MSMSVYADVMSKDRTIINIICKSLNLYRISAKAADQDLTGPWSGGRTVESGVTVAIRIAIGA